MQRDTVASSRPNFDSIHTISRKLEKTSRSLLLRKSQTEQISKVKRMSESRTKREKEIGKLKIEFLEKGKESRTRERRTEKERQSHGVFRFSSSFKLKLNLKLLQDRTTKRRKNIQSFSRKNSIMITCLADLR